MRSDDVRTTGYDDDYHDRQFRTPYESTVRFAEWLRGMVDLDERHARICDLGCGKGASLVYLAQQFPGSSFVGVDIDGALIHAAEHYVRRRAIGNCRFVEGDLHDVGARFGGAEFDGVISLQTLSWLDGYERALDAIVVLAPRWLAVSSLFYEGPIEARTSIREYTDSDEERSLHYNTYSLPRFRRELAKRGYGSVRHLRFDISIDLARPVDQRMQTYTERTADGRRLQISGPLLMNWYFVLASAGADAS